MRDPWMWRDGKWGFVGDAVFVERGLKPALLGVIEEALWT
jgi:hypothetical protein